MSLTREEIRFNPATKRAQERLGTEAEWRELPHGNWALVTPKGSVAGLVKTLGRQFPKKDRRYAVRIDGVEWWADANVFRSFMWSTVRGFTTPKAAMAAIDAARRLIFSTEPDENR